MRKLTYTPTEKNIISMGKEQDPGGGKGGADKE